MDILVLSNGKGEDSLAVTLLKAIEELRITRKLHPPRIKAISLVGIGTAYRQAEIDSYGTQKILPSYGFGSSNAGSFIKDLLSGLTGVIGKQIALVRELSKKADILICVGDIYPVLLAHFFSKKRFIHLATAISVNFRKYNSLEIWLFRKKCIAVFTRDQETADFLISKGVNAFYFGNIMMDDPNLASKNIDFGIADGKKVIGIIPSTRDDAYGNIIKILRLVELMGNRKDIEFLLSFAPNLSIDALKHEVKRADWTVKVDQIHKSEIGRIYGRDGTCVRVISSNFGDVIRKSDLIIGMTGTGNEQASGLGTPVVLIEKGPSASRERIEQYQKLLGSSVFAPRGTDEEVADRISELINNRERLDLMSSAGMSRMGRQGASKQIAGKVFEVLQWKS